MSSSISWFNGSYNLAPPDFTPICVDNQYVQVGFYTLPNDLANRLRLTSACVTI